MAQVVKVTDVGIGILNNRLKNGDTGATEPKYGHWGTGTTAADPTDTALETPATEPRATGTTSIGTTTTTDDTYQNIVLLTCNSTPKAITEVGTFDASSSGNIFIRGTFDVINLFEDDSIQFTIKAITDQA